MGIYKNDIKLIIDYGRSKCKKEGKPYSKEVVIQGLGTLKDLYTLESGENLVEKFVFDRILHRLGICADIVEFMITQKDWEYYCNRMQIYEDYYKNDYKKMEKDIFLYKKKTEQENIIHRQFAEVMLAKLMMRKKEKWDRILNVLKDALKLTVKDWEQSDPREFCLAPEELEIIVLMARCYRKRLYFRKAVRLLKWVEEYSKTHIIEREVRCRFMPLAYLEMSKLYPTIMALNYVKAGIQLLYKTGVLFYIIPLQNQYLLLLDKIEEMGKAKKSCRRSKRRVQEEREALLELCKEVEVDWRCWEPIQRYKNAYVISEMLYRHRTYLGQSRAEFCEGVCSEVAYGKIERGLTVPRRKFKELMKRMGYPPMNAITVLHGTTKEYMNEAIKILQLVRRYQYEEANILFTKMLSTFQRKRLIESCPRNKQFFIGRKAVLDYSLGKISIQAEREQLELALKQTIPEYPNINIAEKPLLWSEAVILNNIANTYLKCENYEKAILIWEGVRSSYQKGKMYEKVELEGYDMMQANYASCIGASGNYKRSIQLCYENIKHFFRKAEMENVERFCYGIVWNREEEMKKEYGRVKIEIECQKKLRQSEIMAKIMKHRFIIKFLKEHREENII